MIDNNRLISALKCELPSSVLITREEALRPYECDGLSAYRQRPGLVALPTTVEQVQHILKTCYEHGVAVIARGAGTGLSGGATPRGDALLLVLSRFNEILEIDSVRRIARVQPGVRNIAISEAAKGDGLYYAPDPSSQLACTIGGNLAENAGGVHCLKYGLTVNNILSAEVITIEGERLTVGSTSLDHQGPDLLSLMCGSEGLLGVFTEITVRLLPTPPLAQVVMAAFKTVEEAGKAVSAIISSGLIPAGMEIMDQETTQCVEDFVHANYPLDAAAIILCEMDGNKIEVSEQLDKAEAIFSKYGATELRRSKDEHERQRMWSGRKAAFPAVGRISPDYYCIDGTIPRKDLAAVLNKIKALSKKYSLRVCNVFHAGDGNLHPLILYDNSVEGELEKTEQLASEILQVCIDSGGSITGEHGVGLEKIDKMCDQFNPTELEQFHAMKSAFDTKTLLNPGKAVPTLSRCAEIGGMHVHNGQLPHPDLERF